MNASQKKVVWLIITCVDATIPVVVIWKYHSGELSRSVALTSCLASLVILNAVVFAVTRERARRDNQPNLNRFLAEVVGLGLCSALATAAGLYSISPRNDYLDLALSNVPLDQIHPEQRALVVELLRRTAANSRDYEREAAGMKAITPALYSAESFRNKDVIRSVSEQYKNANSLDFEYHEQQQAALSEFRNKMMAVDPDYLESFEANRQEQETKEEKAFLLQQKCLTATLALYEYVGVHVKDMAVRNGKVQFIKDGEQIEFTKQLEESKSLYDQFQKAFQEINNDHQRLRHDAGLPAQR